MQQPTSTGSPKAAGRGWLLAALAVFALAAVAVPTLPGKAEAAGATQPIYRLYNPWTREHLYTSDAGERASLIAGGWNYEGASWTAPTSSSQPVYRLFNQWTQEHHYTADENEYNVRGNEGWKQEGAKFYSDPGKGLEVYRVFNPWETGPSAHLYTQDANERDSLVRQGCKDEGIGWYGTTASTDKDLYLGAFFVDTPGQGSGYGNVLCASRDGVNFKRVSTPFTNTENPFHDPSIMYKDGAFYMLSNWNKQDGKFHPMISYSTDLVNWTEPEGGELINKGQGYDGISLESLPFNIPNFDVVAPEWFVDTNGDAYIVFSAGYYGEFHGQPENDRMKPYAVKVDISQNGLSPWPGSSGKALPEGLTLGFGQAYELQGLNPSENYIDGSVYKDGGTYYLTIKKDGQNNQVYANSSMGPTGWYQVNDAIAWGNEGPSAVDVGGAKLLYTDMIATSHGRTGIQVSRSLGMGQPFSAPADVVCTDAEGNRVALRHGTVIQLTGAAKGVGESFVRSVGL